MLAIVLLTCVFHLDHARWSGSCGRMFDQTPVFTIAPAKALTTGRWRDDIHPTRVWSGTMTDEGYGNAPVEMESYRDATGVLRTVYGWFPIRDLRTGRSALRFQIDAEHEVLPSDLDRKIVKRAAAILSSESAWNRADDRKCPANASTWSIYCAMELATNEVAGAVSHRRPAMEVVRTIIDERTKDRPYHHRLMDYNNDPTTHLDDVQSLFAEALARMSR